MAMANYVLSYAFSDQVFQAYAQHALLTLREIADQATEKAAARYARARRERALHRAFGRLNEHNLRDIGLA